MMQLISMLFIFLFVYAGVSKLLDVEKFQAEIGQSPILYGVAPLAAVLVPTTEIIISFLLAIPRFRLAGLLASFGLMIMFTAYIIIILQFSDKIPCSCGGVLNDLTWGEHLVFNCAFIVLAIVGIVLHPNENKIKTQQAYP
jgi:uncharacterized membrane protein YphA (DoxX/SURF4 family)